MKIKSIYISFFFVLFVGTTTALAQTSTSEEVKSLIKKKREFNKKNGYGFRIQLDNGLETSVKTTQSKFGLEFPSIKSYILFESPDWKVQVGDYKTRLVADKVLNEIKLKFPSAIIVPR